MRWFVIIGLVCLASPARAQTTSREPICCVVTAGAVWAGSVGFPAQDANETNRTGDPYFLFGSKTSLASTLGVNARFAMNLTKQLSLEVAAVYANPELRIALNDDIENAESLTAVEKILQVQLDVAIVARLRHERAGVRSIPFLTGGGGISRELHEGHTLVETAQIFFVGGGLTHVLSENRSRTRAFGIRLDGRVMLRHHGAAVDDGIHALPVLGASAFVRF